MKTILTFLHNSKSLLILCLIFSVSKKTIAQEQSDADLKTFKIKIENTKKGIKMQSLEGSAWTDLSFSTIKFKPQAINENGMTTLKEDTSGTDSDFADYLFTITKTKKGVELKGIKGTAWEELNFTLPQNTVQTIDQLGMVE